MQGDWPQVSDLVLVGGGHAHALLLRQWGMRPQAGVRVTVINPHPVAPYTGMLPGHIAGHYTRDELMIDLVRLGRFAGARVLIDRAVGLDPATRQVILQSGGRLRYDVASIDIGIGSGLPEVPGFADHAVAAKPLGEYALRWQRFLGQCPPDPHLVIIGAGVGGCELAMASAWRLRAEGRSPVVTLLERGGTALPGIGHGARAALLTRMEALGVTLRTNASPVRIDAGAVVLADGSQLRSDFTLSTAGARPQGWLEQTGLALTDGFITVAATLQSSDPAVFAVGDCAHMAHAPRPKAGVFAVRQAPCLHDNLRAMFNGRPLRTYNPQKDYLKLISTGGRRAVADKAGLRLEGGLLWRWKDRIDRTFMAKFADYPAMPRPDLPPDMAHGVVEALGAKPMCGGCGAKVGAAALRIALQALPAPVRAEVMSGPGDDAAVLTSGKGLQVLTTDHLRSFCHDPGLMARVAAVHALGDVLAMGARPQAALAQIILPRLGPVLEADMLASIMANAAEVFATAGADILGGHTSVGGELTIGFTVTGLADRIIPKSGARAGDALILTKPIGTGVILAAEMAAKRLDGLLLGDAVVACHRSMSRPLTKAATILAPVATAMTDVTGFGLAGHLLEMMDGAGLSATLDLADVPLLPGALAAATMGVQSTLAPTNRVAASRMEFTESPRAALLFDPQTAGGLLAAVPHPKAEATIRALVDAGEAVALVGQFGAGPGPLRVLG